VSSWYVIAGVTALAYLTLVAWIVVEAITAPLIDDPSAAQAYERWRPTRARHLGGRRRGLGTGRGPTRGRPA
jgi:hypothetical protein